VPAQASITKAVDNRCSEAGRERDDDRPFDGNHRLGIERQLADREQHRGRHPWSPPQS